jgi:hypothetical protein
VTAAFSVAPQQQRKRIAETGKKNVVPYSTFYIFLL